MKIGFWIGVAVALLAAPAGMAVAQSFNQDTNAEATKRDQKWQEFREQECLADKHGEQATMCLAEAQQAHRRNDYATELRLLQPLADQGNAEAQDDLGSLYVTGWGVPQDYTEAVKWFRMAAEQGNVEAMDDLARMYVQGQGVPKNYVQAHLWFNLAAARRHPEPGHLNYDAGARDSLAEQMTPAEVAEAQRLAREWQSQHPIEQARPQ
jgi:TPR repeat protein